MTTAPRARRPSRMASVGSGIAGLAVVLALAGPASAQGMMGHGMMGQGMMGQQMGPGMMGGGAGMMRRNGGGAANGAAGPAWDRLRAYVGDHHLACLSCHALSGHGAGPSFLEIAHRFAGQAGGTPAMAHGISAGVSGAWAGYPAMPGGMATPGQAQDLARMIAALGR